MRAFRLKNRHIDSNRVDNQRDYVGLEKFLKHGFETFDRYNQNTWNGKHQAELYESIDGKWVKLSEDQILELRNQIKT